MFCLTLDSWRGGGGGLVSKKVSEIHDTRLVIMRVCVYSRVKRLVDPRCGPMEDSTSAGHQGFCCVLGPVLREAGPIMATFDWFGSCFRRS